MLFLDSLFESPSALQEQGDKHHAAHQYKEAVSCYDKALLLLQQQQPAEASQHGALLLPVLLNLSATHLQLQHPLQALLYAAAATSFSCHTNSKGYYRAAVALDHLLSSYHNSSGTGRAAQAVSADRMAAAAQALMEVSVSLSGHTTSAAKAQMLAALTNAAAAAAGGKPGTSKGKQQGRTSSQSSAEGEWLVACQLLAASINQLQDCFKSEVSRTSPETTVTALAKADRSKEAGNAAFKAAQHSTALQHYQAALQALQASMGSVPAVLSSRAAAYLEQPSPHTQQHAILDGLTAAMLGPQQSVGLCTAATALLQLDEAPAAEAVCSLGLKLLPGDAALQELLQRIQSATAAAPSSKQRGQGPAGLTGATTEAVAGSAGSSSSSAPHEAGSRGKSSKHKGNKSKQGGASSSSGDHSRAGSSSSSDRPPHHGMTERQVKEFTSKGTADVEQVAMINQLAAMACRMWHGQGHGGRGGRSAGSGRGRGGGRDVLSAFLGVDDRVPKFHEEFSKAGRCVLQR